MEKKRKSLVVQEVPRTVAGRSYLYFLGHTFEKYINVCSKEWIHVSFHFIHRLIFFFTFVSR